MRFEVLGPLRVLDGDGRDVGAGAPQQRALLAALLTEAGRTVSTGALISGLWADDPGAATTTSLQVIVSRLRKRFGESGPRVLVTSSPGYRLQVAAGDVDALDFADLLTRAREAFATDALEQAREHVGRALDLWRGAPYADVPPTVVEAEVARLQALRLAAVELAAEVDLMLGRHAAVADRLLVDVAEHPLQEGLRGSLVVALYRCGQQARALDVYEEGRAVLADELGIDPSPQLRRLHALVLRQDPALDAPAPRPSGSGTTPAPDAQEAARPAAVAAPSEHPDASRNAFVGREEELAGCVAAWRSARAGRPAVLALVGEAGIGKTRLAEEVGHVITAQGGQLVWGRCLDSSGAAPYAPWRQVVQALAAARGAEAVGRALQGRGAGAQLLLDSEATTPAVGSGVAAADAGGPRSPEAARTLLFEGVTAFLEAMAAQRPLAVVVEDLHWADAETLQLAEHVASRAASAPLCLVLTVRDPEDRGQIAAERVLELASRLPTGTRIDLGGLSPEAVRRYAVQRLDAPVDVSVARRLHDRTNGNPFFIAELVRLLQEERAVTGRADQEVPRSVQAVLERRLAHLGDRVRTLLAAAAVLGRDFDVRVLAGVLDRTPVDLVEDVDAATAAGVVRAVDAGGAVQQFTHALVQEVLLAATGPMRRAALHARAAHVLEEHHRGDLTRVAAQLAHHHVAAGAVGDPERAVEACLLAAQVAEAQAAHAEAEQHLRTALVQLAASPGSRSLELELDVRVRLGSLLTLLHGYSGPEVAAERRRALELVAQVGTPEHALSALWGAWGVALVSGDFPAAEVAAFKLDQAAERWHDDVLRLAHHHALGQVRLHQGRLPEAREHLHRAGALTHDHADRVNLAVFLQHPAVTAPAWLAVVLTLMGHDAEADARSLEARLAAAQLGHDYTSAYRTVLEGWREVFRWRPPAVVLGTEAGQAISAEHGFDQLLAFSMAPHGWGLAHSGRVEEGIAQIEQGLHLFSQLPDGHMFGHLMLGALAESMAAAGRDREALGAADRAVDESARTGERFFLAAVHLLRAELLKRTGAPHEEAQHALDVARRVAAETGAAGLLRRTTSGGSGQRSGGS